MAYRHGIHRVPVGDKILHDMDHNCVCGPHVAPEQDEEDPMVVDLVFTHHALDGRKPYPA